MARLKVFCIIVLMYFTQCLCYKTSNFPSYLTNVPRTSWAYANKLTSTKRNLCYDISDSCSTTSCTQAHLFMPKSF